MLLSTFGNAFLNVKFELDIQKQNINFKNLNKMQKMIFSAVALVAFSFAGMANEIEEKKIELKPIEKEYATILKPCYAVYLDTYQSAIDNGANETQAGNVAWAAYSSCTGL